MGHPGPNVDDLRSFHELSPFGTQELAAVVVDQLRFTCAPAVQAIQGFLYRKRDRIGGHGLNDKAVTQAIELSQNKYCSVAATVRGVAEITYDYEIVAE